MRRILIALVALSLLAQPAAADEDPLRDYVAEAISRNLQVEISRQDTAIALSERAKSAGAFYPTIGALYRHTRINRATSIDLPFALAPGAEPLPDFIEAWQWQAGLQLECPLYLGGSLRSNLELHQASFEATEFQVSAAEALVVLEVVNAYLQTKMASEVELVRRESLDNAREHLRAVAAMLEQGMVSLRELRRAEAAVAAAESDLIAAENAVQLARRNLNYLLNRDLEAEVDLSSEPAWADEYLLDEAIANAQRSRPELAALDRGLVAGDRGVDLARAAYYPTISLAAEAGFRDGDIQSIGGRDYWQVSLMAGISLFDASRDDSVASARAQRRRAQLLLEQSRRRIELAVTQSYLRLVEMRRRLSAAARFVVAAEEAHRVAELQFGQGLIDQVTYLDSRLALTAARVQQQQERFAALAAEASLRHAACYPLP